MASGRPEPGSEMLTKSEFEALARFRFGIRRYLRFSDDIVRELGLTPQHYQLLLTLKGFPGRDWASITELADRLRLRHHSVVGLVNRASGRGLVVRSPHPDNARVVRVLLTKHGDRILIRLAALHRDELRRQGGVLTLPVWHDEQARGTGQDEQ